MSILELFIISTGVAMDAFAVSICKGISLNKINIKNILKIGLYFSIFQGLMPLLGYFIGLNFHHFIESIDHYVVFIILSVLGINMIRESFENEELDDKLDIKTMLILSVATSIDAFALGISLSLLEVNIFITVLFIFLVTLVLSLIGVIIGNKFRGKFGKYSLIFGGVILILMGIKILIEHIFLGG